ncbi:MAG: hypothetical protein A2W61_06290 [Deltaproteobacteria bacterium RIFCSPLOWO2_01_44_7]|nr:MAG: hypothetical protein A2712_02790 [Deltaproteobacteria bacterium RIFCSPHIGHO2_01_FULL_43_49]OGQ16122.1 MAG: hypothetical protein A3D22_00760 [Deltaproteobacteria bacterium RIFCSPHIGHO2_02_FULL_44_53]OGQ29083.1 MAG: hypothetical protein A3D98_04545 [Deltaproteobacteria bacterium RIFCSPHIGHO2_12_FULL_44_21]OGQ32639.1 MAG: hypothetical protein A2979_08690 [Deltaproteobacteria bacterium RIFCSPLOWO2_01_FULL_45_74]OGQ38025.1 MAG: hypothetical protein A2W61_06290 [Deltaproteobacteria bacterium 
MQSVQTSHLFSLAGVKPLEGLLRYRDHCLVATEKALAHCNQRRRVSPCSGEELKQWKKVGKFEYFRCEASGSLFLADLPEPDIWADLLREVSRYRDSSKTFHQEIRPSRAENVLKPKLTWIKNVLRLHNIQNASILEVVTPPSDLTPFLKKCNYFGEVLTVDESDLLKQETIRNHAFHTALLLESLDRIYDPKNLLQVTSQHLKKGGLIFVTALVSSGFDMMLLQEKNIYLFPPDRTNCFSRKGLEQLLEKSGFELLEVSTPGILDVEIVKAHLKQGASISLSTFERALLDAPEEVCNDFQAFLQKSELSSFARIVGRKK